MKERRWRRKNIENKPEPNFFERLVGSKIYSLRKMLGASMAGFCVAVLMSVDVFKDGHLEIKGAKVGGLIAYGITSFFILISLFMIIATLKEWKAYNR